MANVADGATGTILTAPSPATSGTSVVLNPGEGYRYPDVPFFAIAHANNSIPTVSTSEKVQVTAQGKTTIAVGSNGATLPQATINVASASTLPASGTVTIVTSAGAQTVTYTGKGGTTLTGASGGTGTMSTGGAVVGDNFTIVRAVSPYSAQSIATTWRFSNAIFSTDLNNASIVRNEVPVGSVNGVNTTFTTASQYQTGSLMLHQNGLRLKGGGNDFTETAGGFTMTSAPLTGDLLLVDYFIGGTINNIGTNSLITDETPTGTINGSNTAFTALRPYIATSLEVYVNGLKQYRTTDFTETTPGSGVFTFLVAPLTGDVVRIAYQFNLNPASNSDTVDGIHASTTATANQLLSLNSTSQFPGSTLGTIRLDTIETTDIHNGTALTANTWTDFRGNQNFTVASSSSIILINLNINALIGTTAGNVSSRVIIDSGGTPVTRQAGGNWCPGGAGNYGNPFGTGMIFITGLSAGVHTIKTQVLSVPANNMYCRATGNIEFCRTQVIEIGG